MGAIIKDAGTLAFKKNITGRRKRCQGKSSCLLPSFRNDYFHYTPQFFLSGPGTSHKTGAVKGLLSGIIIRLT
jgi:hypothetical protein